MNWTALVDADTLSTVLGAPGLRLVDARFVMLNAAPDAGRQAYAQGHLPGAVHADLNLDLSDLSKTGEGRHPLPDEAAFARRLGEWGITPAHQVVVYDAGDGSMAAARAWWLLKLLGHERVAVLDGGLAAWRAVGGAETDAIPDIAPAPAYPGRFDMRQCAGADEVVARLHDAAGWLFDARAAERFRGEVEPIDPIAGHVPGAVNLPFAQALRDGRFKPAAELRSLLSPLLGDREASESVLMCGSGVTACHLLLAFEHAGLHGARIYPGSWSGWISDPAHPVARGD
ncbi:sulfurtransferase [Pseudoxanthomonas sp. Root630]|uniref:sulfurtransferase n=1 Tax=Pseudoxanthomonas sp. Root630 TaxID=1736574 RepID=UPI0007024BE1|nr:sulfurtransferase [Pseudoxanthomonas sp. Root630]KRA51956.1 sulfurtransferase [Pseudoxanthomonas sp. Root630]